MPAAQPQLLSQINERSVLRVLQMSGPCSRAEVTRKMGVTPPTVSKAVSALLKSGLLEEFDRTENGRGRPAKQLRLATRTAQVLGLVIDAGECRLVSAGLDGRLHDTDGVVFATPDSYAALLDQVSSHVQKLLDRDGVRTLGLGISMPGLIDSRERKGLLSPNLPITDGHSPGVDLAERLGLATALVQECHALCLAERHYGDAAESDEFVMLDASVGVGLGVFSGGRLQTGSGGYAGEIGHVPVQHEGHPCGCGRRGCLETLASDTAFERQVSHRLNRPVSLREIAVQVRNGELSVEDRLSVDDELAATLSHLTFAIATAINLFNPEQLFVCSRLFDLGEHVLEQLIEQTQTRALRPSFADCRIGRARGSKREGAVAAIIEHLTDSRVQFGEGSFTAQPQNTHTLAQ